MVDRLFFHKAPKPDDYLLDPGCGTGVFIEGVLRWCETRGVKPPRIVGIESDRRHIPEIQDRFEGCSSVEIRCEDFLENIPGSFDFIIGNPPYVPITGLSKKEKHRYRREFATATGRFDLYLLFFEQSLRALRTGGRLVFITPEKFLYVETAKALRLLLSRIRVEEIRLVHEATFGGLITYPTITTATNRPPDDETEVVLRDGTEKRCRFPTDGGSWLPDIHGRPPLSHGTTLEQICVRVSCGVATGADEVFVRDPSELDRALRAFTFPTIAGRDLDPQSPNLRSSRVMLVPYSKDGRLLPEHRLGVLGKYLTSANRREQLVKRTCVERKPWYAFHETPPLAEILRPKILCKDIAARPHFWIDNDGSMLPRHSVYYIVPNDPYTLGELCAYLNSDPVHRWLRAHCQRAANGFLRLQSRILKQLPIPFELLSKSTCDDLVASRHRRNGIVTKRRKLDSSTPMFEFAR